MPPYRATSLRAEIEIVKLRKSSGGGAEERQWLALELPGRAGYEDRNLSEKQKVAHPLRLNINFSTRLAKSVIFI